MSFHSTDVKGMDTAGFDLIVQNAVVLIKYIYQHTDISPYDNPEIRVGLVIKILLKSNTNYDSDLLVPVIEDVEKMMENKEYLQKTGNEVEKHIALSKELSLLNKFQELDDTLSLNTAVRAEVQNLL